jgi:hypothetical protein
MFDIGDVSRNSKDIDNAITHKRGLH